MCGVGTGVGCRKDVWGVKVSTPVSASSAWGLGHHAHGFARLGHGMGGVRLRSLDGPCI